MRTIFIIFTALLALSACGDDPKEAKKKLDAMKIPFTVEAFTEQVDKGNLEAVDLFLKAGMSDAVQDKEGDTPLIAAMEAKNAELVTLFLNRLPVGNDEKAPVNLQDLQGNNALLLAVKEGNAALFEELLKKGAVVFIYDNEQKSPLYYAVAGDHIDLAARLIEVDAAGNQDDKAKGVNFSNNSSETPLLVAVKKGNLDMVNLLLKNGADPNVADRAGITPLMAASESGRADIAARLLEVKVLTEIYDLNGNTALTHAIRGGHKEVVQLLLDKGADPDFHKEGLKMPIEIVIEGKPFDFDLFTYLLARSKAPDDVTKSVLFDAVRNNNLDIATLLLDQGLNPNSTDEKGATLLYHAIEKGHQDMALLLLEKGADLSRSGSDASMLEYAVRNNMPKLVHALLDKGVTPDVKTNEGYSLAEMAIYRGYAEVLGMLMDKKARVNLDFGILWSIRDGAGKAIPVLLQHGANPNVMSQQGDPALWLAISAKQNDAAISLLKYKAFPNVSSERLGTTALGLASYVGDLEMVKALVQYGAKADLPDKYGMTPLGYAAAQLRADVVEYLVGQGADVKHEDGQGHTVLDWASAARETPERDRILTLLSKKPTTPAPAPAPAPVPAPAPAAP